MKTKTLYSTVRGKAILEGYGGLAELAEAINMKPAVLTYRLKTLGAKWHEEEVKALFEAIGVDVRAVVK